MFMARNQEGKGRFFNDDDQNIKWFFFKDEEKFMRKVRETF